MCRLAAFSPGTSKETALRIILPFNQPETFRARANQDGTGSVHVHDDGRFVVHKYPESLDRVLQKRKLLLDHMPSPSWTIVHLRAATHGMVSYENTHPFIKIRPGKPGARAKANTWAIAHNGIWGEHYIAREMARGVKFEGETDSETAAHLWSIVGPKRFMDLVDWAGVFLGLTLEGHLWAAKTSGDLEIIESPADREKAAIIASEFPYGYEFSGITPLDTLTPLDMAQGLYHFDETGRLLSSKITKRPSVLGVPGNILGLGPGLTKEELDQIEMAEASEAEGELNCRGVPIKAPEPKPKTQPKPTLGSGYDW